MVVVLVVVVLVVVLVDVVLVDVVLVVSASGLVAVSGAEGGALSIGGGGGATVTVAVLGGVRAGLVSSDGGFVAVLGLT